MRILLVIVVASCCLAFSFLPGQKTRIFIAGDSTASIKETKAYPETGWGMPFVYFWDSSITVVNRAKNGRSTRSFREEGLWNSIMNEAAPGDYVIIQFGHNDEVSTKKTYTTENEFRNNLLQYVKETRERGAIPVLLTPVARRRFDSTGHVIASHEAYSAIVRDVAAKEKVLFIDLDSTSQALYQQFGMENSKLLFLQLKPGEHPNYPEGKIDNTHFNELGARLIAQLVLHDLVKVAPALAPKAVGAGIRK